MSRLSFKKNMSKAAYQTKQVLDVKDARIRELEAELARLKTAAKAVVDAFDNAEELDSAIDWLEALAEKES